MSQITLANNNAVVTQSRFTVPEVYYRDQKVITTESLAVGYGAEVKNIQNNFIRNDGRFVEGKHYFIVQGDELKELKNLPSLRGLVDKRTPKLTLWTERGASRHAKMLETDQAWDYFELLEETYFNSRRKNADLISKKDLALMVIQAEEEKEIAYAQRDQAIETKAWISRRREATAMATASAAVREKNVLAAKLGACKKHATVLAVENMTETKFKWHPLKKWCADNGAEVLSVPDERYGKANSYPAAAWKAVHNVNIAKLF
ncbi:ORF6N domain-containing protein [Morganella morganii]|uniref:ORF6N domain-containing protein n=1 Tax=Morganella morganii TaxID=582 RepID=UPI0015F5CA60|nr:ORF6N domain-containing protein [Morganella morganii]EKQ1113501.1 ORF6N domain-containing protein [Morganella morganii]MBA5855972.1 ORF6N domain-containing protein [Morganella morganii]MDE2535525.1 ORF6N domain-containing protein [Morganella morganii]HCL5895604.1 ORF6N domain-containing protein [Morganella morganii]